MVDGVPVIEILEYGLPGFAVIFLILTYRLLSSFQQQMIGVDVQQFRDVELYTAWAGTAQSLVTNARIFMALSALCFLGGLIIAIINPENRILLSVAPEDVHPVVVHMGEPQDLSAEGWVKLFVRNDHQISIKVDDLAESLSAMTARVKDLEAQVRSQSGLTAANTDELGF